MQRASRPARQRHPETARTAPGRRSPALPIRVSRAAFAAVVMLVGVFAALLSGLPPSGPLPDARAADSNGGFEVFGSGALTCERWLYDRQMDNASSGQSEMWVAGYLTAYNFYVYKDYDVTDRFDGEYLLEWIDEYCLDRSPDQLVVAAHELVQMLRRRR